MQKTALESQEETRGGWKSFLAAHPSLSNLAGPTTTRSRWQPKCYHGEYKSYQTFKYGPSTTTSFQNSKVKAIFFEFGLLISLGRCENVLCIRYILAWAKFIKFKGWKTRSFHRHHQCVNKIRKHFPSSLIYWLCQYWASVSFSWTVCLIDKLH